MEDDDIFEESNYVTTHEAAEIIGVSYSAVYDYIQENLLPAKMVAGNYMVPRKAAERFKPKPVGRLRTKPVYWKRYRAGAKVRILRIHVTAHAEKLDTLWEKINHLLKKQEHLFPGTMQRYISASEKEPAKITLFFVWKDTELPDESRLFADLEQFKQAFADLLDWQTAEYTVERALLHT